MSLTLTEEQQKIVAAVAAGQSVLGQAYAGCAKTTTAVAAAKALSKTQPRAKKLVVAFNVKIKEELDTRLRDNPDWECRTMNSLGLGTLKANAKDWNLGNLTIDADKSKKLVSEMLRLDNVVAWAKRENVRFDLHDALVDLTDKAKMFGYRPEDVTPEILSALIDIESGDDSSESRSKEAIGNNNINNLVGTLTKLVKASLQTSIERARYEGLIDFNDQIYLAVLYCGHIGRRWDVVMVDEAQDLSRLNHAQVTRACRTQLVAFGDRFQALYQFRGATPESMDDLAAEWHEKSKVEMTRLQLSTTFRCPVAVVERQVRTVGINDFHARGAAPLGNVFMPFVSDSKRMAWSFAGVADKVEAAGETASAVVLSATNAPLYVAMALLWQDLRCRAPADLYPWVRFAGTPPRHAQINLATSLPVYSHPTHRRVPNVCALHYLYLTTGLNTKQIKELFEPHPESEDAPIVLSTVHRAKGLEWDHVYLLEPERIGTRGNLRYVAETRTREFLGEAYFEDHRCAGLKQDPLAKYLSARSGTTFTPTEPRLKGALIAQDVLQAQPPRIVTRAMARNAQHRALLAALERQLTAPNVVEFDPTAFIQSEVQRCETPNVNAA